MAVFVGPHPRTRNLDFHIDAANPKSYQDGWFVVRDLSGNANGFSIGGTAPIGWNGQYFSLDGVDQYLSTNKTAFLSGDEADRAYEILFRMNTLPTRQYDACAVMGGGLGESVIIIVGPAVGGVSPIIVSCDDSRYAASGESTHKISAGEWVHFFVQFRFDSIVGNVHKLTYYINGEVDTPEFTPSDTAWANANTNFAIGRSYRQFAGDGTANGGTDSLWAHMDVVMAREYTDLLTPDEVFRNFASVRGRVGL